MYQCALRSGNLCKYLLIFDNKQFDKISLITVIGVHVITKQNYRTFNPSVLYVLKRNKRSTKTRCEICSKITIKTPERRQMTSF